MNEWIFVLFCFTDSGDFSAVALKQGGGIKGSAIVQGQARKGGREGSVQCEG